MDKQIETYIDENLTDEIRDTAMWFVEYLKEKGLTFYRDTCDCWKDKIYYWAKSNDKCVCFIAVNDPDEPKNFWTVWSDDSPSYEASSVDDKIKIIGWKYIDHCGNCGS